ncbi:hypothetical protein ACIA8C_09795 [Nocardia sp. NPDC051321]|uniref:hypothetical protein n=1 Tax=Nocardia sp. NPDC051321 TaxID=3364323 RepID=UPI00378EC1D1
MKGVFVLGQFFNAVFLAPDSEEILGVTFSRVLKISESGVFRYHCVRPIESVERLLTEPVRVVWAGDDADPETDHPDPTNLHMRGLDAPSLPRLEQGPVARYLLNHDRRRYVDKSPADNQRWHVHPLVILTAEGWYEGGDHIGDWARERISVADTVPAGFEELAFTYTYPIPLLTKETGHV